MSAVICWASLMIGKCWFGFKRRMEEIMIVLQSGQNFEHKEHRTSSLPCLASSQLNPSSSKHLEFVLTLFLLLPAFLVVSPTKTEDPHMTYTVPVFLWKPTSTKEHGSPVRIGAWQCGLDGAPPNQQSSP